MTKFDKQTDHALKIVARVVTTYGEIYLPVFERLHAEMMKLEKKKHAENLALNLAKKYSEIE